MKLCASDDAEVGVYPFFEEKKNHDQESGLNEVVICGMHLGRKQQRELVAN